MKRVFTSFAHLHLAARLGISLFLVLFAAIALAPAAGPQKQIKSGVRIAGLNVAGFDVGQVAIGFGGGGHKAAAGFVSPLPVRELLDGLRAGLLDLGAARVWAAAPYDISED